MTVKLLPRITVFLMFLILSITNGFAAKNGQFKGTVDGNVFDIPVFCDYSHQDQDLGGFINVISDNRVNPLNDNNKDGIAMDITFFGEKYFLAQTSVKGKRYDFNGIHEVNGSRFTYKKALKKNKDGDNEVGFIVTCNK